MNLRTLSTRIALVRICILATALLAATLAATAARADFSMRSAAARRRRARLLGSKFRDAAGGFTVNPPRHTSTLQEIGLNLATFVNKKRKWGAYIRYAPLKKNIPVPAMLRAMAAKLRAFQAPQILASRPVVISGKPAGLQIASFEAGSGGQSVALLRQQAIVQIHPNAYYVITFFTPLGDKDVALRTFQAMIKTFKVLNRKRVNAQRRAAIVAGRAWLKRHDAEQLVARLVSKPQLFRIQVDHNDAGYLLLSESVGTRDGRAGILVEADSRTFPASQGEIKSQTVAFWAFKHQKHLPGVNMSYSTWLAKTERITPLSRTLVKTEHVILDPVTHKRKVVFSAGPPAIVHWGTELGTVQTADFPVFGRHNHPTGEFHRETRITVAHTGDHVFYQHGNKHQHFVITPAMPAVLPPVLDFLWPRLTRLSRRTRMAFLVYNSGIRKLGLRVLRTGPQETIRLNGKRVRAFKLKDELDPGETDMWVNGRGRILKMRTSDRTVLVPTTFAKMKAMWGKNLSDMHRVERAFQK